MSLKFGSGTRRSRSLRPRAPEYVQVDGMPKTEAIDGKLKASFFTYQRLCENSLATWWRNVFLMTAVAIAIIDKGGDDTVAHLILIAAALLLAWSLYAYYINIKKIVAAAEDKGLRIMAEYMYLYLGILGLGVHGYYTIKLITEV